MLELKSVGRKVVCLTSYSQEEGVKRKSEGHAICEQPLGGFLRGRVCNGKRGAWSPAEYLGGIWNGGVRPE